MEKEKGEEVKVMKILQFLLSLLAVLIGVIFALGKFNLTVPFDVTPYYYLLLILGVITLFYTPYAWAYKEEEMIELEGVQINKKLIHQLIEEEMKNQENLDIYRTSVVVSKKGIKIIPEITVQTISTMSILDKTNELLQVLHDKMNKVFGDKLNYQFKIIFRTK